MPHRCLRRHSYGTVWHSLTHPNELVPQDPFVPRSEHIKANLGKKGEIYVARFRYQGKEFKSSLRTTSLADARAAMNGIERVIHGLTTEWIQVPLGVDPGQFIVSGGTIKERVRGRRRVPPLPTLIEEYLQSQGQKAASHVYTERTHLNNFKRKLRARAERSADQIAHRDLEQYLQARLKERTPSTARKERDTLNTTLSAEPWFVEFVERV